MPSLAPSIVQSFTSCMASIFVNLHSLTHISISLSHELKINMALAEYLPLSFWIFGLQIFLNSSAMSCKLCDAMEASFLILLPFGYGVFGLTSASLSVSFPDVSMLEILDWSKDTG